MKRASDTVLGHNMFIYTENNPVMNTDSTGYCYDYSDEDNDGSRDANQTDGCGSGGSVWDPFGGSNKTSSGGGTWGGNVSVGGVSGSSGTINDIFPTGINSGSGSSLSGSYASTIYDFWGKFVFSGNGVIFSQYESWDAIYEYVAYLREHNLATKPGIKGGGNYLNYDGLLPSGTYKEYRVSSSPGSYERLLFETSTGVWIYTPNHYHTFIYLGAT
jgi:guanyl-specific ribonuclease Sa